MVIRFNFQNRSTRKFPYAIRKPDASAVFHYSQGARLWTSV